MLKESIKPFMAYYICHELWIYPRFTIPSLGFKNYIVNICPNTFWNCMNYSLRVWKSRNGGNGGGVNARWEMGVSSLKLGLSWRYESFTFSVGDLCSALWFVSWHEVWRSAALGKFVLRYGFATLIYLLFRFGGLAYSSSFVLGFSGCEAIRGILGSRMGLLRKIIK